MKPQAAPRLVLAALAASPLLLGAAPAAAPPVLTWPAACRVGADCEIQHYVDRDTSPAVKDYTCGNRTYDAHDGVDIRLPDMAAQRRGVDVLAAADGRVRGIRDGMADVSVRAGGPGSVADRECGNGMIIDHANGFETQYCHLARGSLKVKAGDQVKAGQPLGQVGMSGLAEFPHLHFTVRQSQKVVDPFAYGAAPGACSAGASLWRQTPPYQARVMLNTGFAAGPVTMEAVEAGTAAAAPGRDGPLVAYARAVGLKAGDVQEMVVRAPDGSVLVQQRADPLPRDQAQRLMFIGKPRAPQGGWAKGRYTARYSVVAGGKTVLSRDFAVQL